VSQSKFDFIIVGAGVAGCMLASEITKRELGSVLLLEAGGPATSIHLKVPSQYPLAFSGRHSWGHTTTPQSNLTNRRIALPVGRTLGGSSAINAMIFMRAHGSDFDAWHSVLGEEWSPHRMEEAFRAIEQVTGMLDQALPELHEVMEDLMECIGQSVPRHRRLEQPRLGVGPFVRCQRNGRRQSAWDLQLNHRSREPSLTVRTDTEVKQIEFDLDRATGVQVLTHHGIETIHASQGVILCAGAIHSPRILLGSGIGDAEDMRELGRSLVCQSPAVGQNLHDHLVYPIVHHLRRGVSLSPSPSREDRIRYLRDRAGPRSSNIAEAGGFFAWHGCSGVSVPDYQWHITPTHYLEYPHRHDPTSAISFGVTVLQPKSRGRISLVRSEDASGTDAKEPFTLCIDPAYLTEESDRTNFVRAIQESRELLADSNLQTLLGQEIMPGEKRIDEDQIAKSIARFATTIYHYVGSCRMGVSVYDSVVDPHFRVHGVKGLHVCDASTLPSIVSANPQSTVMMMAYRLANWLE